MKLVSILIVATAILNGFYAFAFEGFVPLKTGREVFVKTEIVGTSQPTILLINGLTYNIKSWDLFSRSLKKYNVNVVRFDMSGQGRVLAKSGPVRDIIRYENQVEDVEAMLEFLKLENVTSVGLSYGGAIAVAHAVKYPMRIARVVAMAPFTEALRQQDLAIRLQVSTTRMMFPFNPASDDELYDFFLLQNVYSTYPLAEPSVLDQPNKLEATFRMVQGIRHLKLGSLVDSLTVPTHLIQAESDQYLDAAALEDFWSAVPNSKKISRATIGDSEHKIPEAQPKSAAAWLAALLGANPIISDGRSFFVDAKTLTAKSDAGVIELN